MTKPAGPIWLVHSWGVESEIIAGLPAWWKWGGKSLALFDYAGSLADARIRNIRTACTANGLRFIPGALFTGGSGQPLAELLAPKSWQAHTDAAGAMKCSHYCIDLEQFCGMNAVESYTEGQCYAIAAMLAQWCLDMLAAGIVPCVYGPWRISTGLPRFGYFCRRWWELCPAGVVLMEYVDANPGTSLLDHPRASQVLPLWLHPPENSPGQYRAAAVGLGRLECSAMYGPPKSVIPALGTATA